MSHIFDALQRSEDEIAGPDQSPVLEATELLRRAEKRAARQWEAKASSRNAAASAIAEYGEALQVDAGTPVSATGKTDEADGSSPATEEQIFGTFQRLDVNLPSETRLVCLGDGESLAAEAFRLLGVRLQNLRRSRPLKKLLVTSTIPQEGKSLIAANLACTLAQRTNKKVLLIDGDLRRPTQSENFGVGRQSGVCEYLEGELALAKCLYRLDKPGLWFMPAGGNKGNALELLESGGLSTLMDQLATWFEWIIIDSPPVLPMADTSIWSRLADGVLLVTRQGITQKRDLQRGAEAIDPKKLIGAIVNSSVSFSHNDYYYGPANPANRKDR